MQMNIDREDCMYLISEEQFQRFIQLIEELNDFTLVLPVDNGSYQRSMTILDIWYLISTSKQELIENPENTMIYPYRYKLLTTLQDYPIKRYIQLALYENEQLAFLCAIYLYKELTQFIISKFDLDEEIVKKYDDFQSYNKASFRPYYDSNYPEVEKYPKWLAHVQGELIFNLKGILSKYDFPLRWTLGSAVDEAEKIYESKFGLINDWGGRVP